MIEVVGGGGGGQRRELNVLKRSRISGALLKCNISITFILLLSSLYFYCPHYTSIVLIILLLHYTSIVLIMLLLHYTSIVLICQSLWIKAYAI